jgi:hypothetical protein
MLRLLAMGYAKDVVFERVAQEFGCKVWVVAKDYQRMPTWIHSIEQNEQLCHILRERLDLFNREAFGLMLDWDKKDLSVTEKFVKIAALNCALKITVEQIKLAQLLGLIECRAEVVENKVSLNMPFMAIPEIAAAYAQLAQVQAAEKAALDKAVSEKAASGKASEAADEAGR